MQDPVTSENKECLCLETYGSNLLGFHDVPNTVLHDLVNCAEREWGPGIAGISNGIYSVISDYSTTDYTVFEYSFDSRNVFLNLFLRERSILILLNILTNQKVLPGEVFDDRRFLKFRGRPWAQAAGEEEATELGASLAPTATGERVSDIDIE